MNPDECQKNIEIVKTTGIKYFQKNGYHLFSFVDNELFNFKAVSKMNSAKEILHIYANTIFESKRKNY